MTTLHPPLLTLQQLRLVRAGQDLGLEISGQFKPGELWHIIGANGIGKSTLLMTMCNVIPAYSGKVDCTIGNYPFLYIGRKSGCDKQLSVLENLKALCYLTANTSAETQILQAMEILGLQGYVDTPFGQLSSGQQQKVMLARLWLPGQASSIWLLDEPFTALDQKAIVLLKAHIQQKTDNHGLVILTSHSPITLDHHRLDLAQFKQSLPEEFSP